MSHISLHGVSALGKKKKILFWYGLSAHHRTKLASAECFAGLSCIVTVDNVGLGSSISREGLSKRSFRMHKRSAYNLYSVHFTMQKKKGSRMAFKHHLHRRVRTWAINTPSHRLITCTSPSEWLSSHRRESVLWVFLDRGSQALAVCSICKTTQRVSAPLIS